MKNEGELAPVKTLMMETEKMAQNISWQRKVRCGMMQTA